MSRADDVAQHIREAANALQAPLLFAIGAASPSPTRAASEAYALGLTSDEQKLAKWVAVLKRDAQVLFGTSFEEALRTILEQGAQEMKVIKGVGYYKAQLTSLLDDAVKNILSEQEITVFLHDYLMQPGGHKVYGCLSMAIRARVSTHHVTDIESKTGLHSTAFLVTDDGVAQDVQIRVHKKEYMPAMKKFASSLMILTSKKGFQRVPTEVTIVQDF